MCRRTRRSVLLGLALRVKFPFREFAIVEARYLFVLDVSGAGAFAPSKAVPQIVFCLPIHITVRCSQVP